MALRLLFIHVALNEDDLAVLDLISKSNGGLDGNQITGSNKTTADVQDYNAESKYCSLF